MIYPCVYLESIEYNRGPIFVIMNIVLIDSNNSDSETNVAAIISYNEDVFELSIVTCLPIVTAYQ